MSELNQKRLLQLIERSDAAIDTVMKSSHDHFISQLTKRKDTLERQIGMYRYIIHFIF